MTRQEENEIVRKAAAAGRQIDTLIHLFHRLNADEADKAYSDSLFKIVEPQPNTPQK